jgi:flagellar assembly protein FliH
MTSARKFAFDLEFAPDGAIVSDTAKKLTSEEIEAQTTHAYARGREDALAEAERAAAAALAALGQSADALLARLNAETKAMRAEAAHVAFAAAKKIAGEALDAFGPERAAAAIDAAMIALRHQPRLVIKLAPAAVEAMRPRIGAMSEAQAYSSAVLVRAEEGLRAGEVVIEWAEGVIVSDPEDAANRIQALIDAALAGDDTLHHEDQA